MYRLNITRVFTAQHFLTVPDCGPENEWHSHHYTAAVELRGRELDAHGYLVDIVDLKRRLDELVARYRDHTLNDLPEFDGLNPSIEHFSRIFCLALADGLQAPNLASMQVRIHEDDIAWASYETALPVADDT